ncbi:glycine betaine ABC transporter substrate-binding protein [Bacillus sp. FJAT-42376]|uniref:glycine betaine ABC transporter substrate-binding protein n=1 Tax=Bacillus sp. FJAT-42376 TaxID=2014076 RepID=UPI000F51628C|nr:glycine betaine ABC transporter substrate-binding protein [Bacillus sp. FJAT-42376]AZB42657.1 glycine betaine ABC transporter substrate-binding protein [Bacillus sp. FJAT-42376]
MKKWNAAIMTAIVFTLVLASCSSPLGDNKKKIKIGMINWIDNISTAYLWKVLLEEKGYDVEMMELDKAANWTGVARGDIDIQGNVWLPVTDKPFYDKYKGDVDLHDQWYKGTKLGIAVPSYMKDINTIDDLNQNKDQLAGKVFGIDPGSSLMQLTDKMKKDYDLDYTIVESSEAAMLVELKKAYKNKKPIAVTLWSPHWIFSDLDLKYLEDTKGSYGKPDNIQYMTRKGFAKEHPDIIKWMDNWELTDDQMSELIKYVNDAAESDEGYYPERGAKKWVEKNRELTDSWFEEK